MVRPACSRPDLLPIDQRRKPGGYHERVAFRVCHPLPLAGCLPQLARPSIRLFSCLVHTISQAFGLTQPRPSCYSWGHYPNWANCERELIDWSDDRAAQSGTFVPLDTLDSQGFTLVLVVFGSALCYVRCTLLF